MRPVELYVTGDASSANRAIDSVDRNLQGLDKTAVGVDRRMSKTFKRMAAGIVSVAALRQVGRFVKESVDLAGSLNDAVSATNQVFGKSGASIVKWADDNNSVLMMTERNALDTLNTFKLLLDASGIGDASGTKMSKVLTSLAADMASFKGTSVQQAAGALAAGLRGEMDPLEQYGVKLDDARLKEEAYRLGLYKGKGPLDARAKAQASYNLVLKQTEKIQGDARRTEGSYANQMRRFSVNVEGLKASFGQAFIPLAEKYLPRINKWLEEINTKEGVSKLSKVFLDVGSAIEVVWDKAKELGRIFKASAGDMKASDFKGLFEGASVGAKTLADWAGKAANAFESMSPETKSNIGLIIGLTTSYAILRKTNPVFRVGVDVVGGAIKEIGATVAGAVASLVFPQSMKISGQPIRVVGGDFDGNGKKTGKGGTTVAADTRGTWKSRLGVGAAGLAMFLLPELVNRLPLSGKTKQYVDAYSGIAGYSAMGFAMFGPVGAVGGAIFGGLSELSKGQSTLTVQQQKDAAKATASSDYLKTFTGAMAVDVGKQGGKIVKSAADINSLQGSSSYLQAQNTYRREENKQTRRDLRNLTIRFNGFDIPRYLARPGLKPDNSRAAAYGGMQYAGAGGYGYGGTTVILQGTVIDPDGAARALRRVLDEHDRRVGRR